MCIDKGTDYKIHKKGNKHEVFVATTCNEIYKLDERGSKQTSQGRPMTANLNF
jgi:hypothetical protein